jgi:hypothetical protein
VQQALVSQNRTFRNEIDIWLKISQNQIIFFTFERNRTTFHVEKLMLGMIKMPEWFSISL